MSHFGLSLIARTNNGVEKIPRIVVKPRRRLKPDRMDWRVTLDADRSVSGTGAHDTDVSYLFPRPVWLALLKKRANPFLRVARHRVKAHDFLGVVIGARLVEIDLRIERLLADRDGERTRFHDSQRKLTGFLHQIGIRNDAINQAPLRRGARIDWIAREQHLHGALAADRARQRDHRSRAEQSDAHARGRKARALTCEHQVAGRRELASGGGRDRMNARDDRLRNRLHRLHQLGAELEFMTIEGEVAPLQLFEIVTCAECWPRAGNDHRSRVVLRADFAQHRDHFRHHRGGQRIALLRPIHGDSDQANFTLDNQIADAHRPYLRLLSRSFAQPTRDASTPLLAARPPAARSGCACRARAEGSELQSRVTRSAADRVSLRRLLRSSTLPDTAATNPDRAPVPGTVGFRLSRAPERARQSASGRDSAS